MKAALMQPYLFPYIGYFQLICAADDFIFYYELNFIKKGWINRNRILLNGKEFMFTVPLESSSSFQQINETKIKAAAFKIWKGKFLATLQQAYRKAPFYNNVIELTEDVLKIKQEDTAGDLAKRSVIAVCDYLEVETKINFTSAIFENNNLKGQDRVIDICKKINASEYINMEGGRMLYDAEAFSKEGIKLSFLKPQTKQYKQFDLPFTDALSILDVLMFCSKNEVKEMTSKFELI